MLFGVSLCITTYNESENLNQLLESIVKQKMLPSEIIFCDAASTDDTVRLLEKFQTDSGLDVKIIKAQSRINIAVGRNIAISTASNPLIAVTDAGCVLDSEWLSWITKPFAADNSIDVVGGYYQGLVSNKFQQKLAYILLDYPTNYDHQTFMPSSRSICFKKEAWNRVNGYPEFLTLSAEDTLFDIMLKKSGCIFYFEPKALVWWEMRSDFYGAKKIHFSMGFGEAEANIYTARYLFYTLCLFFPFLLFIKRMKFKYLVLQYQLVFFMLLGWYSYWFKKIKLIR